MEFIVGFVKLAATFAAIFLFLTPFKAASTIRRERSVGVVSPLPFAMMSLNGAIWAVYGAVIREWIPMVIANLTGFLGGGYALITYYAFAHQFAKSMSLSLLVALTFSFLFILCVGRKSLWLGSPAGGAGNPVGDESEQAVVLLYLLWLGRLGVIICIGMFGSPLVTIMHVCRTRSTASLSPLATAAALVCTALWVTYGLFLDDSYIWGPNLCGLLLSLAQALLFGLYGMPPARSPCAADAKDPEEGIELGRAESCDDEDW